ncbi:TetR/AcrR family transcriptional regulator [Roseovarius nanhaiticus]|uniref:TetR/AcrR family transcriptional regulator n=1 Tax=Roseovarius nanhaiticus TaxID=573024 RepID=UPI0024927B1E|nr:TetR/AcrR family transcriptional regulator [Roseovarius nanhaiticus]
MSAVSGAIRKGRKFDQVLEGAREVFMLNGFDGANVDDIARAAGVSKATLYSYFPDKRVLFSEVARIECDRQASAAIAEIEPTAPVETSLRELADRITRFFLSDFGQQIYRICVAESHRFPDLGQRFYASGPQMLRTRLGTILSAYVARGELKIDDIDMAANQMVELCKSDLFSRRLCGINDGISEADIARVTGAAVEMFLARYGVSADAGQT